MVAISESVKAAFLTGASKDLELAFSNGRRLSGPDIVSESLSIEQSICDEAQLSFGSVGSACFKVQITDTAHRYVNLKVTVTLVSQGQRYQLGVFTIKDDTLTDSRRYRNLTGYDALNDVFDKSMAAWYDGLTFPLTLREFRASFFAYLGINEVPATLINDTVEIDKTINSESKHISGGGETITVYSSELTGGKIVKAICEFNGCFGFINHNGDFKYVSLERLGEIGAHDFYLDKFVMDSLTYREFKTEAPTRLQIHSSSSDIGTIVGDDLTDDANTYHIVGNFLFGDYGRIKTNRIAQNIYSKIKGTSYRPGQVKYQCRPWVEVGDIIEVTPTYGSEKGAVIFPILHKTISGITAIMETVSADGQEEYSYDANSVSDSIGQLGTGMDNGAPRFYRFISREAVTVLDGTEEEVVSLLYEATGNCHVEFIGQITVTGQPGTVLTAKYVVDGTPFLIYHTINTAASSVETISLYHAWETGEATNDGTFQVLLAVSGGDVTIDAGYARGRLMSQEMPSSGTGINELPYIVCIEVSNMPDKTKYRRGETLDYTGLVIVASYSNGTETDITADCALVPADGGTVQGNSEVEVVATYVDGEDTFTTSFYLEISDLSYIEVGSLPNKTKYRPGEPLDFTGLSVSAFYGDGTEEIVTGDCTFSPAEGTEATSSDPITVSVTYTKDGETFTASFDLTAYWLSAISVTREPSKNIYGVGEHLDFSGLTVMAEYTDGSTADVTNKCSLSPSDGSEASAEGILEVSVSYKEGGITETDSFSVTVEAVALTSIAVTTLPTKTAYTVGEALDYTGIAVTATYSDSSTADVTASCTFSPASGASANSPGTLSVTVSYTENGITETDAFDLTVAEIKALEYITVITPPIKTEYSIGEFLDYSGVTITATYTDTSSADVTSLCAFSPASGTAVSTGGSVTVTASYTEGDVTATDSFELMVEGALIPASISVVTQPEKVLYDTGDTIDYTGIEIRAYDEYGNLFNDPDYEGGAIVDGEIPVSEVEFPVTEMP